MRKMRRLWATALVALLLLPMTGCSASDFFFVLFLSLECAADAANVDACTSYRLSIAADRFVRVYNHCVDPTLPGCAELCPLAAQLVELGAEVCSNQQEHPQQAAAPGGSQSSMCQLGSDTAGLVKTAASLGCP
jgi:hypothetical protein